jgi:YidC/Oxa1 family membrane protein insertase
MLANIWNTIFYLPLLNLMALLYHFLGNSLGWSILGIAVIARMFMIPLVKRQTSMTKKMAQMRPELEKLNKKFANNKEKLAQEQMKLYKKVGYNPLGCIGTFIPQIVILSALIGVIKHVTDSDLDGIYTFVRDVTGMSDGISIDTSFLFWDLTKSYTSVSSEFGRISIESFPYIALSIAVGIVQYCTTTFTQKMQNSMATTSSKKKKEDPSASKYAEINDVNISNNDGLLLYEYASSFKLVLDDTICTTCCSVLLLRF